MAGTDRHEALPGRHVVPPAPSTIDLHSHTSRSDGILTPSELATQAAAVGVKLLSITDHDTLAGVRELRAANTPAGLEILPGIELNAVAGDRTDLLHEEIHILGLGVDPDDERLEATLQAQREARRTRLSGYRTPRRNGGADWPAVPGRLLLAICAFGRQDAGGPALRPARQGAAGARSCGLLAW